MTRILAPVLRQNFILIETHVIFGTNRYLPGILNPDIAGFSRSFGKRVSTVEVADMRRCTPVDAACRLSARAHDWQTLEPTIVPDGRT